MPYLNVKEVESALQYAAKKYPDIILRFPLPNKTWENRECHAVRMGKGSGPRRIGVCFTGGIHAREWVCPDILVGFIETMASAYKAKKGITLGGKVFSAAQIQQIVNNLDLFIFPQVNPDGRNRSQTSDIDWRKNMRPAPPKKPGCEGVDINRNFDFLWHYPDYFDPASAVSGSTNPCDPQVFIGPGAASEPETKNVVWLFETYPNIRFYVDVHSYSELILYDWGDDEEQTENPDMNFRNAAYHGKRGIKADSKYREYVIPKDRTLRQNLAGLMQKAIKAVRNRNYKVEQSFGLYPTAGTSTDYAISRWYSDPRKTKMHAFCIECGTTFWPPDSERPKIMKDIIAALLVFCLGILELGEQ
jgi:carboxypeptidase T